MKRSTVFLLCAFSVLSLCVSAHAGIRDRRPNLICGELGGRAVIYSIDYERFLSQRIGIGAGVMGFAVSDGGIGLFPIYVSAVPVGDVHGLYVSAGVTYAGAADEWDEVESLWFGTGVLGYLYQSDSGFLFRATANLLFREEGFLVLPGLAFGGSF